MKAMILKKFGGHDSFELRDVAIPEVDAGELLVRVMIKNSSTYYPLHC